MTNPSKYLREAETKVAQWSTHTLPKRIKELKEEREATNPIHRLEAAEGPSRELDGEIWCAANGLEFHSWDGAGVVWLENGSIRHQPSDRVKEFSASLDAAVSLVPEGAQYCLGCLSDTRVSVRGVSRYHAWVGSQETVYAASPALALCIAALKARES